MGRPRPSETTATITFTYESAYNQIVEPTHYVSLSQYFIAHWMPQITPNGLKILLQLRAMGYYNPKAGVSRGDIDIEQKELAALCGMSHSTLKRAFTDDLVLSQYVQRVFHVKREPRTGRIIKEHYVYAVKMDDPIHDDDWPEGMEKPDEMCGPSFPEARGRGYVYLLESGGVYKIGKAKDPDRRITQIAPKLPYECRLVHAISSDDCLLLERWLHERFGEWRLNGEWFELTAEQVRWFQDQAQINQRDLIRDLINQKDLIN